MSGHGHSICDVHAPESAGDLSTRSCWGKDAHGVKGSGFMKNYCLVGVRRESLYSPHIIKLPRSSITPSKIASGSLQRAASLVRYRDRHSARLWGSLVQAL